MKQTIRFIPFGGALVLVTHRCFQARFLLTPTGQLNQLAKAIVARAAKRAGVEVVVVLIFGNHVHLLLRVPDAEAMAEFMNYFAGNLAREAGRLHDWSGKFWHRQYSYSVVADDEASQAQVLRYLLAHGCKEDLVASPLHWPGLHPASMILEGPMHRGIWVNRTALCRARHNRPASPPDPRDYEEEEILHLSQLPCWADLSWEEYQARVRALVKEIEEGTRARHRRDGTRPVGRRRVLAQDPHGAPKKPKKGPGRLIIAASEAVQEVFEDAYRQVVEAFATASAKLRAGNRRVQFPVGTFPPALPFVRGPAAALTG
ncbi:MAG: transposase [Acidobacteriota bacterium]|nr:transposase [Acidobacteriota bacterium]